MEKSNKYSNVKGQKSSKHKGGFDPQRKNNFKSSDSIPYNVLNQDPFFYAKDQKALENMANIFYNQVVGDNLFSADYGNKHDVVPYACMLHYKHVLNAEDGSGVGGTYVQRAADAFFNYFTQGFTTGVNFEAPDVLMAVIAAASLASFMVEAKRPYGLVHHFLQWNSGYPKAIIKALGFDFNDLKSNLAEFRTQYNLRVATFNKTIAIPKSFMLLLQWGFIAGNLFTDTTSPEYSTIYGWKLDSVLEYNPTKLRTGTCLSWFNVTPDNGEAMTVTEYFNKLDTLFARFNDSDVREMFGAIRRVYAESDLLTLTEIDLDYVTNISVNDTVAAQFHNAGWVGTSVLGLYPTVDLTPGALVLQDVALYQTSTGEIKSDVVVSISSEGGIPFPDNDQMPDIILDMYDHLVNPGANIDVTAYMNYIFGINGDGALGDRPTSVSWYTPIYRSTLNTSCILVTSNAEDVAINKYITLESLDAATFLDLCLISHLDSHPLIMISDDPATLQGYPVGVLGEIDKYTLVPKSYLQRLNQQSMYQLLAMPANSKSTTR
nr:putative capsid [Marmot picobirnavirus]